MHAQKAAEDEEKAREAEQQKLQQDAQKAAEDEEKAREAEQERLKQDAQKADEDQNMLEVQEQQRKEDAQKSAAEQTAPEAEETAAAGQSRPKLRIAAPVREELRQYVDIDRVPSRRKRADVTNDNAKTSAEAAGKASAEKLEEPAPKEDKQKQGESLTKRKAQQPKDTKDPKARRKQRDGSASEHEPSASEGVGEAASSSNALERLMSGSARQQSKGRRESHEDSNVKRERKRTKEIEKADTYDKDEKKKDKKEKKPHEGAAAKEKKMKK